MRTMPLACALRQQSPLSSWSFLALSYSFLSGMERIYAVASGRETKGSDAKIRHTTANVIISLTFKGIPNKVIACTPHINLKDMFM